jgi:hypothetical protein
LDNVVLLEDEEEVVEEVEDDFSVVPTGDRFLPRSKELAGTNPSNCELSPFSVGDTLDRIALHEEEEAGAADGAVETDTFDRRAYYCGNRDDSSSSQPAAESAGGNTPRPPPPPPLPAQLQGPRIVVQPHRAKGHLVSGIFALVMSLGAFWTMNKFQTIQACSTFYTTFLYTIMIDIVLAQPLAVLLTVLYRWLTAEEEATLWSELHPVHHQLR